MAWMRQNNETDSGQAGASYDSPAAAPQAQRRESVGSAANVNIGQSIQIKGTLTGKEDLTIDGVVEGKIQLKDHVLTIGANGRIKADVHAKQVVIVGQVDGNVTADDKVDIAASGSVTGDIRAPRVAIADGASFKGRIEMGSDVAASSSKSDKGNRTTAQATVQEMPRSAAASS
jgi:cytoskeletal protein CcmA (bactofilin family)